jgi:hypothetical protein
MSLFGSVVAGAFQIAFRAEMYANDFFYFLKIIFNISTSKRSKKYKPHSILTKKKFKFRRNASTNTIPNVYELLMMAASASHFTVFLWTLKELFILWWL